MLRMLARVFFTIFLAFQTVFSQNSTACSTEWSVGSDLAVQWNVTGLDGYVEVRILATNHPFVRCLVSAERKAQLTEGEVTFKDSVTVCSNSLYNVAILFDCGVEGNWTDETTVWTEPDAPEALTVSGTSSSTLLAEWTPPYGTIDDYVVILDDHVSERTTYTRHEFRNLDPYSAHAVQVSACHQQLCGLRTKSVNATTLPGVPSTPTLQPIITSNTSARFEWEEPEPFVGPIDHYDFRWRNEGDFWSEIIVPFNNSYALANLEPYTWYKVEVRAVTEGGTGNWSSDTFRTDVGIPNEPKYLNITEITATSIHIEWEDPKPSTGPILSFNVCWGKWNGSGYDHSENHTSGRFFTVEDLQPLSNYSIKVRGMTSAGYGNWSEEAVAETVEDVPAEPSDLKVVEVTNTSIFIEWMEPEPVTETLMSYIVRWKKLDDEALGNIQENSTTENFFVLDDLQPYSNYSIRVRGENAAGLGNWSKELLVETKIGVPYPPWNLHATDISNTTIALEWKEANITVGPATSYLVNWTEMGVPTKTKQTSTEDTFYLIEDLMPYTSYVVKVRARTIEGPGDWSDAVIIETHFGIPLAPVRLIATSTSNSSLTLEWADAKPSKGPILDYAFEWGSVNYPEIYLVEDIVDRTYTISELDPYTNYSIRVRARTSAGNGNWTPEELFQTLIGIPSTPLNVTLLLSTNTSLKFEWREPAKPNGPLLPYEVRWYRLNAENSSKIFECREQIFELSDLAPYTFYSIRIAARTIAGRGQWSPILVAQTLVGIPDPAVLDVIEVEGSRKVIVSWKVQGMFPGPTEYLLKVWKKLGPCSNNRVLFAKSLEGTVDWVLGKHRTRVDDLIPHTRYFFKIVLKTTAGERESNYSDEVWTKPEVPGSPEEVTADCDSSPTEARVCWKPPKEPNGEICEYVLEYSSQDVSKSLQIHVDDACGDQSVLLNELRPERPYTISVKTKVRDVDGPSPAAFFQEKCELPAGVPPVYEATLFRVERGEGANSLFIEWSQDIFSDGMGALLKFAVLVGTPEAIGNLSSSGKEAENVMAPTWRNFTEGLSDFYQATPLEWNPFEGYAEVADPLGCEVLNSEEWADQNVTVLRCGVGLQEDCSEYEFYCNGPLKPDTSYAMKLRAFTRGGYADTHLLLARTASYPKHGMGATIAVGIIACLLILSFMAGVYVIRRKGSIDPLRKAFQSRFENQSEPDAPLSLNLQQYQTKGSMSVGSFAEHVRLMMSDSHLRFSQEFEKLKRESPPLPCSVAEMDENRAKNRWMNIFPFDHSRVKLLPLGDEPGSDFINANYIPGASSLREYIASQGPLATTVDDFWRMIWEQSVTTIVMLTQCVERGKNKCEEYWPPSTQGGVHYGDLLVRTLSESMLSSYVIRIFQVQLGSRERQVKQLHFTRWPDFGCPESPDELLNLVRAVRDHLPRTKPGPIIVHCSAGVGRTGTFITVDRLAQELGRTDEIDVYGTVLQLRNHRTNMVQTEDQYIYIHLCVQQLVLERNNPKADVYEDVIYSNIGAQVTGV